MKLGFRIQFLRILIYAMIGLLAAALFHTQVINGCRFRRMGDRNRIRLVQLEAPRGSVYDRKGVLLAASRKAYQVYVIPEDFNPMDVPVLRKILGLTERELRQATAASRGTSFTPVLLKGDVSKEVAMQIEERRPRLGGVFIQIRSIRTYPEVETAAHIVGYVGRISPDEYRLLDRSVYQYNSSIGRAGVERAYDLKLRGEDGGWQLEVDARGVPIRVLSEKKPLTGEDIYLSIDAAFEKKLGLLLGDRRGAILVMNLKTGELLAAVSTPGFDPNIFVTADRSNERIELIGSKNRPLFDRSLNGLYPPGSVFKLVTAMAALDSGLITPETTFSCPGYFHFKGSSRMYKCWFHEGHGRVDLYTAIERSCNVYFYNVGRLLGNERLAQYARKLGFGSEVAMDLPTAAGLVPDEHWKRKQYHESWYPGETISFAIGQSYLLVSPLQILRLIAVIATDGQFLGPKLLRQGTGDPVESEVVPMRTGPATFRTLRQAMLRTVSSDKGTAQLARLDFGALAAKTGTAQAPPGIPHAWFAGFYPYENPQIALVVFVERGTAGGLVGAKIAKQTVKIYNELYGSASL